MSVEIHTITPRTTLHFARESRFKSEMLSVHFFLPFTQQNASAYYILPAVLKAGCSKYGNEREIARALEELYGADICHYVKRCGDQFEIAFSLDFLATQFTFDGIDLWKQATDILFHILYHPNLVDGVFAPGIVRREKFELLNNIKDRYNYKDLLARDIARAAIFSNTTYGYPLTGRLKDVRAVNPQTLWRAYTNLIQMASVHIYYSGVRDIEIVNKFAIDLDAYHPHLTHALPFPCFPKMKPIENMIRRKKHVTTHQTQLVIAYSIPYLTNTEREVLALYMAALSYSPVAKLYRQVREQQSLCYNCDARADAVGGIIYVNAGIAPGTEKQTYRAVMTAVKDMETPLTDEEYQSALAYLTSARVALTDTQSAYRSWYFRRLFIGEDTDIHNSINQLKKISIQDITTFASKLRACASVVVAGVDEEETE